MKRVILLIFYAMISVASLHADNEPDFYFEGLGYNIMSFTFAPGNKFKRIG